MQPMSLIEQIAKVNTRKFCTAGVFYRMRTVCINSIDNRRKLSLLLNETCAYPSRSERMSAVWPESIGKKVSTSVRIDTIFAEYSIQLGRWSSVDYLVKWSNSDFEYFLCSLSDDSSLSYFCTHRFC